MEFFTAVRNLTTSAHQSILQAAGHSSRSGESQHPWCQPHISSQADGAQSEGNAPPLLVPYPEVRGQRSDNESQSAGSQLASDALATSSASTREKPSRRPMPSLQPRAEPRMTGSAAADDQSHFLKITAEQLDADAARTWRPEDSVVAGNEFASMKGSGDVDNSSTTRLTRAADTSSSSCSPASSVDAGRGSSSSLGSLVASFAAAAAHSLVESIEQSSQQLFRPPGIYQVTRNIWIMQYPDPESPNTEFIVAYLERHYANKYMILNVSERQYQRMRCSTSLKTAGSSKSCEDGSARESTPRTLFPTGTVIDAEYGGLPYPPLSLMLSVMLSVHKWLQYDSGNVLLVHCFKGFSRSITFLAAYLHWVGIARSLQAAVHTLEDVCGVDATHPLVLLPSQKRFLRFFQQVCVKQTLMPSFETKKLRRVILNGFPSFLEAAPISYASSLPESTQETLEMEGGGEVALFRPVFEVWHQGRLIFSSLTAYVDSTREGAVEEETCGYAQCDGASVCDGARVPAELMSRLPVYKESDGSIRFDIPGLPLSGDILLKLLHVTPQFGRFPGGDDPVGEQEAASDCQEEAGWRSRTGGRMGVVGRKVCTARVAFHTDMTKEGGYLEVTKAGMDGAVVLSSFPDTYFMSIFFEELGADEPRSPEEEEKKKEEVRLLVQARSDGAAVRAARLQKTEEQGHIGKAEEIAQYPVDEEDQRRMRKRMELRQHVQEYKALAEQWRLAASEQPASSDDYVASSSTPGTEWSETSRSRGACASDANSRAGDGEDFQVFEARLTDGESNGYDDGELAAESDFCGYPFETALRSEGAGERPIAFPRSACGGPVCANGVNLFKTSPETRSRQAQGSLYLQCCDRFKRRDVENGGGSVESESDVSWGNSDDEGREASDASCKPINARELKTAAEPAGLMLTSDSVRGALSAEKRIDGAAMRTEGEHDMVEGQSRASFEQKQDIKGASDNVTAVRHTVSASTVYPNDYKLSQPGVGSGDSSARECPRGCLAGESREASGFTGMTKEMGKEEALRHPVTVCDAAGGCASLSPAAANGGLLNPSQRLIPSGVSASSASEAEERRSVGSEGGPEARPASGMASAVSSVRGGSVEWTALTSQSSSPVIVSSPGTPLPSEGESSDGPSPHSENDSGYLRDDFSASKWSSRPIWGTGQRIDDRREEPSSHLALAPAMPHESRVCDEPRHGSMSAGRALAGDAGFNTPRTQVPIWATPDEDVVPQLQPWQPSAPGKMSI
ncbi:hypothetical protein BESB_008960 [Besnoitia besnoiti]|uniref:Tyrosine specific protein phosphatases domain-containing protein n=1 Tax=Besnoitia besnoiti TaxID=94643 RepID=A0A2A9MMI2_BESBE|nr:hypothetical protein BESB_008960 [Besnoitia besnoiti]PFH38554.1 hypothetical protein BESB_008960 [Besnoitia besnoiti]